MPLYSHLELLHKLSCVENLPDKYKLTGKDVKRAQENSDNHFGNAGVVHLFADIVATLYENPPKLIQSNDYLIQQAINAANRAIELDNNYIKYRCTKTRLLLLKGSLDDALNEINEAISKTSPGSADYSTYLEQKIKIVVERGKQEISSKIEAMKDDLSQKQDQLVKKQKLVEDKVVRNIEFIGFFAAVIALVLGGLHMAANERQLTDAIKLIIVLFACLLCVFAGFGIILHGYNKKKSKPNIICFFIGLGAIILMGVLLFLQNIKT